MQFCIFTAVEKKVESRILEKRVTLNIECGKIQSIKWGHQKPNVISDIGNTKKLGRFMTKVILFHS